jgi:hypothetical protein
MPPQIVNSCAVLTIALDTMPLRQFVKLFVIPLKRIRVVVQKIPKTRNPTDIVRLSDRFSLKRRGRTSHLPVDYRIEFRFGQCWRLDWKIVNNNKRGFHKKKYEQQRGRNRETNENANCFVVEAHVSDFFEFNLNVNSVEFPTLLNPVSSAIFTCSGCLQNTLRSKRSSTFS